MTLKPASVVQFFDSSYQLPHKRARATSVMNEASNIGQAQGSFMLQTTNDDNVKNNDYYMITWKAHVQLTVA